MTSVRGERAALRLQCARCLSASWKDGKLQITSYLTRRVFTANAVTIGLLSYFAVPRTIRSAMSEFSRYSDKSVTAAILQLIEAQLLLEAGSDDAREDAFLDAQWQPWLPEAGFHFLTKDTPFVPEDWSLDERLKLLPASRPPAKFKTLHGAKSVRLPAPAAAGNDAFFNTLHARRTHRVFGAGKLAFENVSRLLHSTWGVQGYYDTDEFGALPYKTSPSGGARHPGEVYVMALRVEGLSRGMYHYDPRNHRLERLQCPVSARRASQYCAGQSYFGAAAALFIMTAVFARTMWKYRRGRAYRVVLLETGHLCQTFCLTATRLELAPFCTAALKDSMIEADLGIDGISESVLYVAGVGMLPEGSAPGQLPERPRTAARA